MSSSHPAGHDHGSTAAEPDAAPRHSHVFLGRGHARNERRTWAVIAITLTMMVAEIAAGTVFGSMALLADGWHMFTHASALMIAALAYGFARRHAGDPRFTFGTGKLGDLAAFASAVVLGVVSLLIGWESVIRLWSPAPVAWGEALVVAAIGLAVNLGCAVLLAEGGHHHGHGHGHGHDHEHDLGHGHGRDHRLDHAHPAAAAATDHNLRAARLHVIADALTSVLAILALVAGRGLGWPWLDPAIGLVGALMIARWSIGLMRTTGAVLVDYLPPGDPLEAAIRAEAAAHGFAIADLHLWQLGPGHRGAILSVMGGEAGAGHLRAHLRAIPGLSHVTLEVIAPVAPPGASAATPASPPLSAR